MTLTVEQVNELIRHALTNALITSSGGDSPKTNRVLDLDVLQAPSVTDVDTADNSPVATGGFVPSDVSLGLAASRGANPGAILSRVGASLGPAAIIAAIPQIIPVVVDELQRPGGIIDKRVKIIAQEEAFAVLDRQTRQNTRIGDRQVIIQQFEGFRANEGFESTNTSDLIRKNADRVLDIGLFDRAQGMSLGGQ